MRKRSILNVHQEARRNQQRETKLPGREKVLTMRMSGLRLSCRGTAAARTTAWNDNDEDDMNRISTIGMNDESH